MLAQGKKELKLIQNVGNIIVANIFKTLRLLAKLGIQDSYRYGNTIIAIQSIAKICGISCCVHFTMSVTITAFAPEQIAELQRIQNLLVNMLKQSAEALEKQSFDDFPKLVAAVRELEDMAQEFDQTKSEESRIVAPKLA